MTYGKFATAIKCMDGRTQLPVIEFMKWKFGVDYVDMVTEARADKILECAGACLDSVKSRAEVSVKKTRLQGHGNRRAP